MFPFVSNLFGFVHLFLFVVVGLVSELHLGCEGFAVVCVLWVWVFFPLENLPSFPGATLDVHKASTAIKEHLGRTPVESYRLLKPTGARDP